MEVHSHKLLHRRGDKGNTSLRNHYQSFVNYHSSVSLVTSIKDVALKVSDLFLNPWYQEIAAKIMSRASANTTKKLLKIFNPVQGIAL